MTSAVVAIPGPLSYQEGPFILPNLPGWAPHISNVLLTEALGFTAVIVHDTDLGVLGEYAFGAGRGVDDLVCITVSTGVGAGVGLGGRLVRGQRALATVETI
jgi:glucokinase